MNGPNDRIRGLTFELGETRYSRGARRTMTLLVCLAAVGILAQIGGLMDLASSHPADRPGGVQWLGYEVAARLCGTGIAVVGVVGAARLAVLTPRKRLIWLALWSCSSRSFSSSGRRARSAS